jgi:copper chaperone CopZ
MSSQMIELKIGGMTCNHCVHAVTTAVQDVAGVEVAKVSLELNSAVVEGEQLDLKKIIEAIEEEGYTVTVA